MQVSIIMIIIFNHCFFTCRVLIRNPKLGHCLLHSYSKLRYVASHKYFKSSGRKGLLVPYKFLNCTKTDQYLGVFGGSGTSINGTGRRPASKWTRRLCWISPSFEQQHPRAAMAIQAAPSPPWIYEKSKEKFLEKWLHLNKILVESGLRHEKGPHDILGSRAGPCTFFSSKKARTQDEMRTPFQRNRYTILDSVLN